MTSHKIAKRTNSTSNIGKNRNEDKIKLIEKLSVTIKMKYNKIFKEINYTTRDLISDLNELVKVNNLPFETYLIKIEKKVLDIVGSRYHIQFPNEKGEKIMVTEMKKIEALINKVEEKQDKKKEKAYYAGSVSFCFLRRW